MTPRQLQAFAAVAQTLSFVRACERLHLSQPALSLSIRNLEEELGGPLLHRTTRHVRLTEEGAALLPLAQRLLADWDDAREQVRERFTLQRGHVALAAMPSFAGSVLPRVLRAFRSQHPRVEITVHDVVNEQVVELVTTGRVEIGLGFEPEASEPLRFERLFTDRFVAIVPPGQHAGRRSLTWSQLLAQDFITLQRPSSMRRLLEESVAASGLQLRVALESHQLATVIRWVAAGLGASAVPSMLRQQARDSGARVLPLSRPVVSKAVGILTRRDPALSTAAAAMREALRDRPHLP